MNELRPENGHRARAEAPGRTSIHHDGRHVLRRFRRNPGGVFHVSAEKTVGIHFKNDGNVLHEAFFGRDVVYLDGVPDGFVVSLFADVPADVFIYQPAKTEVATERGLAEIELGADGQVWIRTMFPAEMKGEWKLACFVPGHYEQGMKATLIIE